MTKETFNVLHGLLENELNETIGTLEHLKHQRGMPEKWRVIEEIEDPDWHLQNRIAHLSTMRKTLEAVMEELVKTPLSDETRDIHAREEHKA